MLVRTLMTSSMLCKYQTLMDVNFWNEDIFLDMADWDLCYRIRKTGKICVVSKISVITHSLGEGIIKFGVRNMHVIKPFREYYTVRESIYLMKKSYVPLRFKLKLFMTPAVKSFLHVLFMDQRRERLRYIIKGIHDGINGITGAIN